MLVPWLMNTIDPEVKSMLPKYENAKKLWDDLHERFCLVNGPRIQKIEYDINKCEQTKNMTAASYYSKLSVLWDELDRLEPLIACQCGKCSCNVGKQDAARRDGDRLQQFLLGLYSEYYAPLRSTLLCQDPLPSLNRSYQQVSQDENVRGISRLKEEPSPTLGFSLRAGARRGRGGGSDRQAPVCEKCKKVGHETVKCWSDKTCTYSKKQGHEESRCCDKYGWLDSSTVGRWEGSLRRVGVVVAW
ncbi:Reticulon-1 [Bienertia sinuspersici]